MSKSRLMWVAPEWERAEPKPRPSRSVGGADSRPVQIAWSRAGRATAGSGKPHAGDVLGRVGHGVVKLAGGNGRGQRHVGGGRSGHLDSVAGAIHLHPAIVASGG